MAPCESICWSSLLSPRDFPPLQILLSRTLKSLSFISLGLYGILYSLTARRLWIPAALLFLGQYAGYAVYVVFRGVPSPVSRPRYRQDPIAH